jgi:hypothetical protein
MRALLGKSETSGHKDISGPLGKRRSEHPVVEKALGQVPHGEGDRRQVPRIDEVIVTGTPFETDAQFGQERDVIFAPHDAEQRIVYAHYATVAQGGGAGGISVLSGDGSLPLPRRSRGSRGHRPTGLAAGVGGNAEHLSHLALAARLANSVTVDDDAVPDGNVHSPISTLLAGADYD